MEQLDHMPLLVHLIVNNDRTVHQFAHKRPLADGASDAWEPGKQVDVIEQGSTEAGSRWFAVLGDMTNDLREVAQGSLREEKPVIH